VWPRLKLAFSPITVRPWEQVTATLSGIYLGIDSAAVDLSRPGQRPVHLSWRGSRTSGVAIQFTAPDVPGDWAGSAVASGEGIGCSNGHWVYGQAGAITEHPVTLTVEGSVVLLPLTWNGPRSSSPTQVAPSATPSAEGVTATSTAKTPATGGTPATATATHSLTPTPSATPTVTSTALPMARYLLIEQWTNDERGPRCRGLQVDFPMYFFDPASGVLETYAQPPLEPADIGYFGQGNSITGMGGGAASGLSRIEELPFAGRDVELRAVDEAGHTTLVRNRETIMLEPGGEKRWQWTSRPEEPGCVVTTTLRVTNFGYQDRSKIVYH
jgi:hypothetical protein